MRIRWKDAGRVAGFLLSLLLLLALCRSGAEAAGGPVTRLDGADALLAFAESVNAGDSYAGRTVVLTDDVDMTGRAFAPIGRPDLGPGHVFQGTFDGGGHAVTGLTLAAGESGNGVGFFSETYNATVEDLVLEVSAAANGPCAVGGLVGWMTNGTVRNVLVTAHITAARWDTPEDGCAAAGIVAGKATGRTVMDRCGARGDVNGAGSFRWAVYIGGFIGYIQGGGGVSNCYTTAGVYANDAGEYVGGFFGGAVDPPPVRDSYAAAWAIGSAATAGAYAGYCTGGPVPVNVWYDRSLNGDAPAVAAPADCPAGDALLPEHTGPMQDSVFPSRLSGAFYQAAPGQNRGYPVLDFEAPAPLPTPTPTSAPAPSPAPTPAPTDEPAIPTEEPIMPAEAPVVPTNTPIPSPTGTPVPTIAAPSPTPGPTEAPAPPAVYVCGGGTGGGDDAPSVDGGPVGPKTGDGTALLPWAAALALCTAALAALARRR